MVDFLFKALAGAGDFIDLSSNALVDDVAGASQDKQNHHGYLGLNKQQSRNHDKNQQKITDELENRGDKETSHLFSDFNGIHKVCGILIDMPFIGMFKNPRIRDLPRNASSSAL